MKRDEWEFPYPADELLRAAQAKGAHHEERYAWWQGKKGEIVQKIKDEGLEIDESLAAEYSKISNYGRGTTVQVRNDLMRDLNECGEKIKEHRDKMTGYLAWVQVLGSQGIAQLPLNQDDWLYFFGK